MMGSILACVAVFLATSAIWLSILSRVYSKNAEKYLELAEMWRKEMEKLAEPISEAEQSST